MNIDITMIIRIVILSNFVLDITLIIMMRKLVKILRPKQ